MSDIISLGLWIKRRRKALDLTQGDLAQRVGCSLETIRKIEADARRPSRQIAAILAEQLGLPPVERAAFIQVARAELSVDRLAPPAQTITRGAFVPGSGTAAPTAAPTPHLEMSGALPSGTVTFLLTDIAGSTKLWEQQPEAMQVALAHHDTLLRDRIATHGGMVVKGMGDGIHAVFTRPSDAVAASVAAQRALLGQDWDAIGALGVRMALHTGSAEERDRDYFGPTLNRLARLLATGHHGQILVSAATQALVCDQLPPDIELRDLGRHHLKDLARPEHIFQISAPELPTDFPPLQTRDARPDPFALHTVPLSGGAAPLNQLLLETDPSVFVTRTHALARLDMFLDASRAGQGQLIFITGEAGSGKTALAHEFARRAQATSADLIVVGGTCNAHTGAGEPYLPFREILELLTCDRDAHLTSGLFSAVQAQRLWALFPATLTAFVEAGGALINTFVTAQTLLNRTRTLASSPVTIIERLERLVERSGPIAMNQHDLFRHYTAVLTALAAQQPLLLILDDLQWADTASINLLFHLGQRISGSRILLIGMYRPDDVALGRDGERHPLEQVVHECKRYHGDIELDIDRAAAEEGQQFVDALLDNEPNRLGSAFRAALYRQTAGHPLFTVELVRGMQARGDLVRDADGYWIEGPALEWDVLPARVEGVLAERIGRLSEELQNALAVASVEGETFTAEVVAHVLAVDKRGLVQRLSSELDRHHLLIRSHGTRRVGGQRLSLYQFRHFLFQKYLYQRLDAGEQGYLHEAVATALEVLHAGYTEEIAAQLARHYEESGALEQAIIYLRQVGERAHQLYANQEAIDAFQHALDLLEAAPSTESQQPQWQGMFNQLYERLGDILHPIGRPGDARSAYEHALSRIPKHDRIWYARLQRKIGSTFDAQKHYEAALHGFDRAESTLGPQPTDPTSEWWQEWMWLQQARLGVYYMQGQWREMNALIGTVQPIIERHGTPAARARFFLNIALMLMRRDRYVVSAETLSYLQAALTAGQESGNLNELALYQFNLGFGHLWRDEFDVAEAYIQTALTAAERIDGMWLRAACLTYLTLLYRRRGQIDDVRRLNVRGLAAAERGQYPQYIGMAKANLAWIAWYEGHFAEAQVYGDAALDLWQQPSVDYPIQWAALLPLIGVALAQQQITEALAYARGLLGATQQRLPDALMVRIEAAIQAGEAATMEGVRTHLEHLIADAQALGYL